MTKKQTKKLPFYRQKKFLWPVGIIAGLIIVIALAFRFSPWPGALIIRTVFNSNGHQTLEAMEEKLHDYPVTVLANQQYQPHNKKSRLDVYMPNSVIRTSKALPTVVWTHGGAWLSGDKKDAAPYFQRLADQGFTVIAVNYTLAPEERYPAQLHQLNAAHAYIKANATRYHVNSQHIILAGDSAGSQLSSQMAAMVTSKKYAKEVGVQPALTPSELTGVVLFCGIYKMEGLTHSNPTAPKIVAWGSDVSVWAYAGTRDKTGPLIRQMSPYYHVASGFPDTFISGGNEDPLTNAQSKPLADKLKSLNVPVTTLFYPANHTPALPHEYQFTFNNDGEKAFAATVQFLRSITE